MKNHLPDSPTLTGSIIQGFFVVAATGSMHAAIVLQSGASYSQNFDSMHFAQTNLRHDLPNWWTFTESGVGENDVFQVDGGENTVGDTYSYRSTSTKGDRALGVLRNAFNSSLIGVSFANAVGADLIDVTIAYTGEQWRFGSTGGMDRLDFQYSVNATSLTNGTWIDFDSLDFIAPNTADPFTNGNSDKNRRLVSGSINSLSVGNGGVFWIRWTDFDSATAEYGLAVDDFTITAVPEVTTTTLVFFALAGVSRRRRAR
jgi:hypothetical protein